MSDRARTRVAPKSEPSRRPTTTAVTETGPTPAAEGMSAAVLQTLRNAEVHGLSSAGVTPGALTQLQRLVGNQATTALLQRSRPATRSSDGPRHGAHAHGATALQRRTRSNAVKGAPPTLNNTAPEEDWEGQALAKSVAVPLAFTSMAGLATIMQAGSGQTGAEKALGVADTLKTVGTVKNLVGTAGAYGTLGVAKAVGAANKGAAPVAEKVASGAGGAGSIIGALGGVYEGVNSGLHALYTGVQLLSSSKARTKDGFLTLASEVLTSARGFLTAAGAAISASAKFIEVAQGLAAVSSVLPIVGSAIALVTGAVDTLIQTINIVKGIVRIVKARKAAFQMKAEAIVDKVATQAAEYLKAINVKRQKRAILGLVQAFGQIFGNVVNAVSAVLNIIGVATAGAMGAGGGVILAGTIVGAGGSAIKVGSGLLGTGAGVLRSLKQGGRDFAAGDEGSFLGRAGKKVGNALNVDTTKLGKVFNLGKSSSKKAKELDQAADNILAVLRDLKQPEEYTKLGHKERETENQRYEMARNMVRAAGTSPRELIELGNALAVKNHLKAVMKQRE